jgi:Flp pilus assembly protein protease CpaA
MLTVFSLSIGLLLLTAAIYDLIYRAIPLIILIALVALSFLMPFVAQTTLLPADSIYGGGIVGGLVLLIYLLTGRRGIGEADIFLSAVIGLLFGWKSGLLVFSAANMIGLLVMLPLILIFGRERMKMIPLGTFLVIAIFLEWAFSYAELVLQTFLI